jgi:hypothetical protein
VKNKRLIAVLLVFIFVAGVAISSVFVFRVSEISAMFMQKPKLLTFGAIDSEKQEIENTALKKYSDEASEIARGKNILFGINRSKIIESIQANNPLVRVTNIEAKFPNKLEIRVRERIPMYSIEYGEHTAVMDFEMQIISTDLSVANEYVYNLIDLNSQFDLSEDFIGFEIGDNLRMYTECTERVDTLILMAKLFFNQDNFVDAENQKFDEPQLCHLIQSIDFTASEADILPGSMVIKLTDPENNDNSIRIELVDYQTEFNEKLRKAWYCLQSDTDYQRGFIISEYSDEHGKVIAQWLPGV